jgi:hypothetical protein
LDLDGKDLSKFGLRGCYRILGAFYILLVDAFQHSFDSSLHIGPSSLEGVCRDIVLRRTPDPGGPPFPLSYIRSRYLVTVPYI